MIIFGRFLKVSQANKLHTHGRTHSASRRIMLICWPITSGVESSLGLENMAVKKEKKKPQNEQRDATGKE